MSLYNLNSKAFLTFILVLIPIGISSFLFWKKSPLPEYEGPIAENFGVLDHRGNYFELYQNQWNEKNKALVLITHGLGCPVVQKNIPVIKKLAKKYQPEGIQFYLVNSNPQDSRKEIMEDAANYQIELPILLDPSQFVARGLKATRTCEAFFIETRRWRILYQGALDDRLNYGFDKFKAQDNFLQSAIESYLNHSPIPVSKTEGIGCALSFEPDFKSITYHEHIAPILAAKCLKCHSPGGYPPQNFSSYEDIKGWKTMIREVIRTRRMPLWEPDSFYGEFLNDGSLTDEESRLLISWIESGAPEGRIRPTLNLKTNEAPKVSFRANQKFGPFTAEVPATTSTPWKYIYLGKAEKDLWITSRKAIISSRGLLQHLALIAMKNPMDLDQNIFEPEYSVAAKDHINTLRFALATPNAIPFPAGTAFKIPKGSHLYLEEHFALSGKSEALNVEVQLQLHSGKNKLHEIVYDPVINEDFVIPPEAENFVVQGRKVFEKPTALLSFSVHMHMRGKSMKATLFHPDGSKEVLLSVPKYFFKNRAGYGFKTPKVVKAGTVLEVTGVYDNSPRNPFGLDSKKTISHGPDPVENEMFNLHLFRYDL